MMDKPPSISQYAVTTGAVLLIMLSVSLIIIVVLNGGMVNRIALPIFQYTGLIGAMWQENPLATLAFLSTKSIFALAHQDTDSGLNLWTLEFSSVTLTVDVLVAVFASGLMLRILQRRHGIPGMYRALWGLTLVAFSVTYMTSIEHCAGPTWAGFVALYGLGHSNFEVNPMWQIVCAVAGLFLMLWGWMMTGFKRRIFR